MSDLKEKLRESYKEYNKEVIEYMDNLVTVLLDKYGEIDPAWTVSLELIAFNYDIIKKCQKDIKKNGLEKTDARGRMSKNPCLMVCNQAQQNLIKFLNAFGLNISSASKIKDMVSEDDGYEDLLD